MGEFYPLFNLKLEMKNMVKAHPQHIIEWVNVEKFDVALKREKKFYIYPGGEGANGDHYEKAREFLFMNSDERFKNFGPFIMPWARINQTGRCWLADGKHRFSVLRDEGAKFMPMSMYEEHAKNAAKNGYLVKGK